MSKASKEPRPLWRGWAVVGRLPRGGEWAAPDWARLTRADAIREYGRDLYDARRKNGSVRCVRVALVVEAPDATA